MNKRRNGLQERGVAFTISQMQRRELWIRLDVDKSSHVEHAFGVIISAKHHLIPEDAA